jgi:hypothetical protein
MKNPLLLIALFAFSTVSFAQEEEETKKEGWETDGVFTFLINQSAFSNWIAGGENSLAGNLSIDYNFNYYGEKYTWENKLLLGYGLTKTEASDYTKKTDDRINFSSLVSLNSETKIRWSFLTQFRTQFTDGYEYFDDANGEEDRRVETRFMSPGYLMFGPGLLYEPSENFKINASPATAKMTFVNKSFTSAPDYEDESYFGVGANKSTRFELGFNLTANYKATLMENVTIDNTLNLYSNYLEDPQNVDIDYTLNLVMKINDILSTNLSFQTIYDDNAFEGFQVREVLGLGVNATF